MVLNGPLSVIDIDTENMQKSPRKNSFEALDRVALVRKGNFLGTYKKAVTYHP